jgi:replicative DNA helicase
MTTPIRQAPHSPIAEAALIGAVLIDPASVFRDVAPIMRVDDLYGDRHREIWEACVRLSAEHGGDVPLPILVGRLRQYGDDAPGRELERLMTETPGPAGAASYAREVAAKARLRRLCDACHRAVWAAGAADASQADAVLAKALADITPACTVSGATKALRLADVELACIERLESGERAMIPTGLSAFDGMFDGLPESGTVTVLGYPGSGKSTLALSLLVARAAYQPVRVYQVEMAPERMGATVLSQATQIGVHAMMNQGVVPTAEQSARLRAAQARHTDLPLTIAERSADAPTIYAECVQAHAQHGPGCVLIDYVQDLPGWGQFVELVPKITESMRVLSMIARDMGWLVVIVSQLGKEVAKSNREPGMADGVGSGAIEQRSDLMLSVWREHQGEPCDGSEAWRMRQRKVKVRSLKNKYGPLGAQYLAFDGASMTFRGPTPEEDMAWNTGVA